MTTELTDQHKRKIRRLRQIYNYLQALDQHRNPVKRYIQDQPFYYRLRNLPKHTCIKWEYPIEESSITNQETDLPRSTSKLLSVLRPKLCIAPKPPKKYEQWVIDGWDDPFRNLTFKKFRKFKTSNGETKEIGLNDDLDRVNELKRWKSLWEEWALKERPSRKTMQVFELLYKLFGTIEREGEQIELMIGDGILNWRLEIGGIHHPILLQPVKLLFDPKAPKFSIVKEERAVELYSTLLRSVDDIDGHVIAKIRSELEDLSLSPFDGSATTSFLKGLVLRLSARGEYHEDEIKGEMNYPRIFRDPILFYRSRSLGYAKAIEAVLENLPNQTELPEPVLRIAGIEDQIDSYKEEISTEKSWLEPEDILLSLPANPEQIQVARRLEQTSSVVVQGPPGTGKTHTIANLIGHLLSKGENILITSHTAKALSVLKNNVASPLQPLCISVLGSDNESRKQLERSIEVIIEKLSMSDPNRLKDDIQKNTERRSKLINNLKSQRNKLSDSLKGEFRSIQIAGESYEPSEAARKVKAEEHSNSWIPGPVQPGIPLPLSIQEIDDLYCSNESINLQEESELKERLPKLGELYPVQSFKKLVESQLNIQSKNLNFRKELWLSKPLESERIQLQNLYKKIINASTQLKESEDWELTIMEAGARGGDYAKPWNQLLEEIKDFILKSVKLNEKIYKYGPKLAKKIPLEDQHRIAGEILAHLKAGKGIKRLSKLFHRDWKNFIEESRTSDKKPSKIEHFSALLDLAAIGIIGNTLKDRLRRQSNSMGLPFNKDFNHTAVMWLEQIAKTILGSLEWHSNVWLPIKKKLSDLGFQWDQLKLQKTPQIFSTPIIVSLKEILTDILPKIVISRLYSETDSYIKSMQYQIYSKVENFRKIAPKSKILPELQLAIKNMNINDYHLAINKLKKIVSKKDIFEKRKKLIEKLKISAPLWAKSIINRENIHGKSRPPGDANRAWVWRQLNDELENRNKVSPEKIQKEIERKSIELQKVTAELIELKSWFKQTKRTNLSNRQALIGWRDIINKTPKSSTVKGKLAKLRKKAREAMQKCREAVPVWIMPFNRVVENFDFTTTKFDSVIIDEASQSDVMCLLVYYLARKVLIVGDHEQVSPAAVGQNERVVYNLIDEHLQGIPNAILYDGKTSIYDLARQSSGGTICLLEHFRCVPQIIQFSNDLSYDGRIKPLRDPNSAKIKPSIIPYRVNYVASPRKTNKEEAEVITSLLIACLERQEYDNMSFGVISLVGEQQALEIDNLLRNNLPPDQYIGHNIVCGNAAHFQGDERDVVFLSVVDSPQEGPLPLKSSAIYRQRFNVAASRAKDQLWVIYSLNPDQDTKPGDLRWRLIKHALDPDALVRKLDIAKQRTESEFESQVAQRLIRAGYQVTPQWQVGYYRIDLVAEGNGKRIAIECDGDRYHPAEKIQEDMERQAILERLGWEFIRIRGSLFFRNPERAMKPVFEKLQRIGISPQKKTGKEDSQKNVQYTEVLEIIKRRASEIKHELFEKKNHPEFREKIFTPIALKHESQTETQPKAPVIKIHQKEKPKVEDIRKSAPQLKNKKTSKFYSYKDSEKYANKIALTIDDSDFWYKLSHWAKMNNHFENWERKILYTIGKYLKNNWPLSVKQIKQANRISKEAIDLGFDSSETHKKRHNRI